MILKLKQRTSVDDDRRHWKATKALIFVMPLLGFGWPAIILISIIFIMRDGLKKCLSIKDLLKVIPCSMHYRLRGSIGFLNVQKKSKSKRLFLTQGIPKSDNFALFVEILTQILYQKNFINFSESKYGQNHGQCSEKVERGLSGG